MSILDWKHIVTKDIVVYLNHTHADNISSTLLSHVYSYGDLAGTSNKPVTGLQYGLGEGGNPYPLKQDKDPDDLNLVFSGRIG